jgi:hypothetical protein
VLDSAGDPAGTLLANTGSKVSFASTLGRDYAEQDGPSASNTFLVDWIAPAAAGNYRIYFAGNAVDGGGSTSGDSASFGSSDIIEVANVVSNLVCTGTDLEVTNILAPADTGSTIGAGDDWQPSCATGSAGAEDVAFEFQAPIDGIYTFDTFGSAYDTSISLWDIDDCVTELACNDDAGTGRQSEITWVALAGETVVVVVDGFNGAAGDYVFNVSHADFPACLEDEAVLGSTGAVVAAGNTCGAGNDVDASCATDGEDYTIAWTAPSTGDWQFSTVGSDFDTLLTIQRGLLCEESVCDDDTLLNTGNSRQAVVVDNIASNETVYVTVHGFSNNCGDFVLHINDATLADDDADGVPDGSDVCVGADNLGDIDADGVCDDLDLCDGDDATGDNDDDGVCDDLDFSMTQTDIVSGQPMTFTARNAPPNANVFFLVSAARNSANPLCHPVATDVCTDLSRPTVLGTARANASGVAELTVTVPPVPSGFTVYSEAAWFSGAVGDTTGDYTNQSL